MPPTLASDDDIINSFLQQVQMGFAPSEDLPPYQPGPNPVLTDQKDLDIVAQRGADVMPMCTPPPEDLPPYEPGPNPVLTDQKVLDIVMEAVSSLAGKNALQKAIDDLGDSAFSIEVCFTNVARGLASALARTPTPDLERDIRQFQAEWDHYRRVIAHASRS